MFRNLAILMQWIAAAGFGAFRAHVIIVLVSVGFALPANQTNADELGDAYLRGMAELREGNLIEALPYFQQALAIVRERYGADDPRTAVELNNLGEVYRRIGNFDEAERLLNDALALERQSDPFNPAATATSLNNLALIARQKGEYAKALDLYTQSRDLLEDAYGPAHPDVARNLNNVAMVHVKRGEPDKAEPLARRASEIVAAELGTQHPTTQAIRANWDAIREAVNIIDTAALEEEPQIAIENRPIPKPDNAFRTRNDGTETATKTIAFVEPAAGPGPSADSARDEASASSEALSNAAQPSIVPDAKPVKKAAVTPAVAKPSLEQKGYLIHLASVRSVGDAMAEWQRFRTEFPELAELKQHSPEKVTVEGQGQFFRVTGGSFETADAAAKFCDLFKARDQYCGVLAPN